MGFRLDKATLGVGFLRANRSIEMLFLLFHLFCLYIIVNLVFTNGFQDLALLVLSLERAVTANPRAATKL